jgi:hypothetical protein
MLLFPVRIKLPHFIHLFEDSHDRIPDIATTISHHTLLMGWRLPGRHPDFGFHLPPKRHPERQYGEKETGEIDSLVPTAEKSRGQWVKVDPEDLAKPGETVP